MMIRLMPSKDTCFEDVWLPTRSNFEKNLARP